MKITKLKLKQLIREALDDVLHEAVPEAGVSQDPKMLANATIAFVMDYCQSRGKDLGGRPILEDRTKCSHKTAPAIAQINKMKETGNEKVVTDKMAGMFLQKMKKVRADDPELFNYYAQKKTSVQERRRRR